LVVVVVVVVVIVVVVVAVVKDYCVLLAGKMREFNNLAAGVPIDRHQHRRRRRLHPHSLASTLSTVASRADGTAAPPARPLASSAPTTAFE
jgi:hypothetical protein